MNYNEYLHKYNVILNNQQNIAVQSINGQTLLLAVPGSGKTTVIVARIGYMLFCNNIPPDMILTLTYSVTSAKDMKARFAAKFGEDTCGSLEFRTIHSFCNEVLNRYKYVSGRNLFELAGETETSRILRQLYREMNGEFVSENVLREIKTKMTYSRNMMLSDNEIKKISPDIRFNEIYCAYKKFKIERRMMDYDDQLEYALAVLRTRSDILGYFQEKYRYISVDEAQDTSKIQHEIIYLLAQKYKNIFMVGDEDQSIYGFRAAYPQALLEFGERYPNASVLLMETNYRSTGAIVARANEFIKQNKKRHDKNMTTLNDIGQIPQNTMLKDCGRQYNYLLKVAINCECETAVLYRNNKSAIPIINILEMNAVPYRIRENEALFFTHYIVTDIVDILSFADGCNNTVIFENIYYKIGCGINKIQMENIVSMFITHSAGISIFDFIITNKLYELWQYEKIVDTRLAFLQLPSLNSFMAILHILTRLGYSDYLQKKGSDTTKVDILLALADQNENVADFLKRIPQLHSIIKNGSRDMKSNFILSTIHSSKGLEYEKVIMIDVKNGIMPSVITPPGEKMSDDDLLLLEEERRLFYVGVTRAKRQLDIFSYELEFGKKRELSPFVKTFFAVDNEKKTIPKPVLSQKQQPSSDLLSQYFTGVVVKHCKFGSGVIVQCENEYITVKFFRNSAIKKLSLSLCLANGLIDFD
ncbi:MAG: ATP-dependent helicase [Eubacteriales bacterium]